jgi:hypothetical protein
VGAIRRILPALGNPGIEKIRHQTVGVKKQGTLGLEHTGSLKLRQTLKLILRESVEKIQNEMTMRRMRGSKKSTDQRRARGDSGQK